MSKGELVVKEYSSGGGGGGRGSLITFADLTACSPIELDRLSYALISYLAYRAMLDPHGEALLFLTLPDGSTEVIHGRNLDVLASVVHIF
ncbi:MAG TPA: hypothetical protein EYH02_03295, partial [Ignisphaera aggregans]|nr:hypothetical protein [Ignisphaera aggregans]